MRILIDSYNNVMQHEGGGVQMRISKLMRHLSDIPSAEVKLFDKWNDKLREFDILHEFKDTIEPYALFSFAKEVGVKIVLSSIVAQDRVFSIESALLLNKIIPFSNTYSLLQRNLSMADAILAQTNKEASFIAKHYKVPDSKIHVIPNGVNEDILNNYDGACKKDIVLCVGRFDHNKNQYTLIEAAKGCRFEVHFIGGPAIDDPSYFDFCKQSARGHSNIIFHGWLKNSDKEYFDLYKRARVIALVSHHEIFGNSLIEGAACGANLLATDVLPTEEWGFDSHCIKVRASDMKSIREGLVAAYNMPMDSYLHDVVARRFSWEYIAKSHLSLYESLFER